MKKVLTISFALLAGLALFIAATRTASTEGLAVGDTAPNFSLQSTDGDLISLDSYEGAKGFIVIFTCNHCPYSVLYEDRIIALHNEYADKGYPVIAINPNDPEVQPEDSYEKMKVRSQEKAFPFKYIFDEGQTVYPAYGAERTPHVFLLDADHVVRYIGAIDDNPRDATAVTTRYVENAIAALESGEAVEPSFTKAIGCTIKTK